MNFQEITSLIKNVASTIEANEKIALPIVAAKARREAFARPNDAQLMNASQVLTKMASSGQVFINKDELREIVNRFGASHSKLSSIFTEELGKQAEYKPHTFQRDSNEGVSLDRDYKRFSDPILANALNGAFEKNPLDKRYSEENAKRAHRATSAQLISIGLNADNIETFAGCSDFIICKADHNTPKGISSVLIPVEINKNKAILPTLFLSREGFKNLQKGAYIDHLMDVANKGFRVDGSKLLDVLTQAKYGSKEVVNEVEMAAIKIASENGSISLDSNSIMYATLDEPQQDVQLPKMAQTEESKFADTLSKPEGIASFVHGSKTIEAGRSVLTRKLADMGYNNVQIKVAEVEQDKVFFAVAIGTGAGIKVPVEIVNNKVLPPNILFANDMVSSFNKSSIDEIVKSDTGGNKRALAIASPCYDMKPTELLDVVKKSVAEGNFIRAEDAINVLGEIDPNAQKVAISHMMMNIYQPGKNPSENMKEINKIAKKTINDTPQFMSYKIFFPEGE